jgi:hypothetical protein
MRNRWLVGPVAALLLVAGCSGSPDDAPQASESPSADPGATPADAEELADTATVEQWASVIAEQQLSVDEAQESWDDATCSPSVAADGAADCVAYLTVMGLTASTAAITIGGAADPDSPTYIGDPPEEIADLVAATIADAEAAAAASEDVDCFEGDCLSDALEFHDAWNDLRGDLAAWTPYL